MYSPEFFKYFSLISTPLFGVIALMIIKNLPEFSFKKDTISKSVYFIKHPTQLLIFRLNFVLKMMFDLCFSWYLIGRLKILFNSPLFWLLVTPPILFGSLSFFIMGKKYAFFHRVIIFSYGILSGISGIYLAKITSNSSFVNLTIFFVIVSNILILGTFIAKKINVFIQVISVSLLYSWLVVYVFQYL